MNKKCPMNGQAGQKLSKRMQSFRTFVCGTVVSQFGDVGTKRQAQLSCAKQITGPDPSETVYFSVPTTYDSANQCNHPNNERGCGSRG
mmetsp:Transcript_68548/g.121270  ORF Transcript_68548/g.121270 Transcript_68548/m.121270 type:complete len:88 (-) Transcript_68548:245-508(-)